MSCFSLWHKSYSCLLCLDLFHIIKILILRQAIMMYKIKSVLATVVRRKPSKMFLILPSLTIRAGDFLTSFFFRFLRWVPSSYEVFLPSDISWIIQANQATVMCRERMLWGVKFRLILVDKGTIGKIINLFSLIKVKAKCFPER